ncbi:unnamed protein product [Candidula unifasciata]|uniref:G-protein coupled receptors family 1 profile domain-containing protein n=1 Tax=Candidula unifasciata TaxID=100452 RepID=A0A8S3ZYE5_9EUPU|nr:unnamed protein product [Candidula unifasciata]
MPLNISSRSTPNDMWLIDSTLARSFTEYALGVAAAPICLLGIMGNLINILVFLKQGFREVSTMTFFSLAVSDLGCLLTLLEINIFNNPLFKKSDLALDISNVSHLIAVLPHTGFSRVTSLITAYTSFERCICVMLPLKVKLILTPRRTIYVILMTFLIPFLSVCPIYTSKYLVWDFDTSTNRSFLATVKNDNNFSVSYLCYDILNIQGYVSFFLVIIFTTALTSQLKKQSNWRKTESGADTTSLIAAREGKIIKIVITICAIYIASFCPMTILYMASSIRSQLHPAGRYGLLYTTILSVAYNLEAVSCSINIFVYRNASSKYRKILDRIFCAHRGSQRTFW